MIIKRDNDKIIIDFKNDIIHTFNDNAITLPNEDNDNGKDLEIRNLHIIGSYGYSQLGFIDKVKLLCKAFKSIFLNKE